MAVDIIEAKPTEFRGRQVECLAAGMLFAGFGLAPFPNLYPDVGYLDLWWLRLLLLAVALPFFFIAGGLLRPVTLPVLEIGRDSIRYTYGDQAHTVARAAVARARVVAGNLLFQAAMEERLPRIAVRAFDRKAIRASLERHGWT